MTKWVVVDPTFADAFKELKSNKGMINARWLDITQPELTLFAKAELSSFLTFASSRCFCSTLNFAAVALSMSLALKETKREWRSRQNSS